MGSVFHGQDFSPSSSLGQIFQRDSLVNVCISFFLYLKIKFVFSPTVAVKLGHASQCLQYLSIVVSNRTRQNNTMTTDFLLQVQLNGNPNARDKTITNIRAGPLALSNYTPVKVELHHLNLVLHNM